MEIFPAQAREPNLLVYTQKYGITESFLGPNFSEKVASEEAFFELNVPQEIITLCKEIESLGGRALLVGGSVRDAIISHYSNNNHKPKDFDLEVYGLSASNLQKILETKYGEENLFLAGKSFNVLKLNFQELGMQVDVSIPRYDSKVADAGHSKSFVVYGDPAMSIKDAAKRRDITINSLAYDPLTQTLYDQYNGVKSIENKTIEVTDRKLFQDDPLRVFRIMQFSARFDFKVTEETVELCREMVESGVMDTLSRERVEEEFSKMLLKGIKPSVGLEFAKEIGLVQRFWPELNAMIGVPQEPDWHPEGDAWVHTLQVLDAAADIATRENLNREDRLVFMLACLSHDFGKPSTTEFIDGAIRSRGHEQAGVDPARIFVERIYSDKKARLLSDITRRVLPLVAEHMKPKEFWKNEVKKGIKQKRAIMHLASKLSNGDRKNYSDGSGASIYLLSLVAEADQRGRNTSGAPFSRDEVKDLANWQNWLIETSKDLRIDKKGPDKILTGQKLLNELKLTQGGLWMGVVLQSVYLMQLDGEIETPDEALQAGLLSVETFKSIIEKVHGNNVDIYDSKYWQTFYRSEDPRVFLI